jgi:isoamylase
MRTSSLKKSSSACGIKMTNTHLVTPSNTIEPISESLPIARAVGSLAPAAGFTPEPGQALPLGPTLRENGVNFSLFSDNATSVELLLFDKHDDAHPRAVFTLSPRTNKTFHFWHIFVQGVVPGMHYAFRVDGPTNVRAGYRFDKDKVLIDPYARANTTTLWRRGDACRPGDNVATSMRSVVADVQDYDWEGDAPLRRPMSETIIYEMHVGGFTRAPSAKVRQPGTFDGLVEKIPYLKSLGITAVELLPVFQFDDAEARVVDGRPLRNYWGYSTVAYFAPHPGYCVEPESGSHLRDFRDMVKALHRAGIEVILDVVFNHTDEGNHQGPVFSFKGLGNTIYYYLSPEDRQYYYDFSGCGNTLNCNHPIVEKFVLDCLRFWVRDMHVDGFRFDEASVLSRGQDGRPLPFPPVLWHVELDDVLAETKVIAEAWDAAGLYQVGHFPGYRWAEWNGRYRDAMRRFVRGDAGIVGDVAGRLSGSADLYESRRHQPVNSINFIVAHDGFTLNDLVSYNQKHNKANGEGGSDGIDDNLSWNCGVEGPSSDAAIERLRDQQVKNFAALLLLSQGVPMFVMGDEVRRSQSGNNNAYCQDNELGWFDWALVEKNAHLLRFWQQMVHFRRRHPAVHRSRFFTGERNGRGLADIEWHGCELGMPGWNDPQARALAFTLGGKGDEADLHVMMNMYWEALDFAVPTVPGRAWHRAVDTSRTSPDDICAHDREAPVHGALLSVAARSVVVLLAKNS